MLVRNANKFHKKKSCKEETQFEHLGKAFTRGTSNEVYVHKQLSNISLTDEDLSALDVSSNSDVEVNLSEFEKMVIADDEEHEQLQQTIILLKEENLEKNALIEKIRKEHLAEVMEMEEKLKGLSHEKRMLELKLDNDLKAYDLLNATNSLSSETRLKATQDRTSFEITALKTKLQEMEARNPILIERFAEAREELRDLNLSEAKYVELKAIPEQQQTLKDFVLVRSYEIQQQYRKELEGERKNIASLNNHVRELERNLSEHHLLVTSKDDTERHLRKELELSEARQSKMQKELAEKTALCEENNHKVQQYDQCKARLDKLEKDNAKINNELVAKTAYLEKINLEKEENSRKTADERKRAEMLNMDKMYLLKEAEALKAKVIALEDQCGHYQSKIRKLKEKKEELNSELLKTKDDRKVGYEQKIQAEVERLRNQTQQDLEQIRINARELFERERRTLIDAKESAVTEMERARMKLAEVKQSYDILLNERRDLHSALDSQISELNSQIKMKDFELERLIITHEDTLTNVKQCNLIIEQQRKKIEMITSEYYTLQNETTKRITELEAVASKREEQLTAYEQLEKDLDTALLSTGGSIPDGLSFLSTMDMEMPAVSKRRVRHTVQLSRKMLQLQRANQDLTKEFEMCKTQITQLTDDLAKSNDLLNKTHQPYNYLVNTIRERDLTIEQLTKTVANAQKEVAFYQKEAMTLRGQMEEFRKQLPQVEQLKSVIVRLQDRVEKTRSSAKQSANHNTSTTVISNHNSSLNNQDLDSTMSKGIHIVSTPTWYKKLKQNTVQL